MSKQRSRSTPGTMLDLWRPPRGAGTPIGCLATTYTFNAGLFDEQCLGRFLEVDSDPNREDLAYLLERETRLGSVYAGVMVDHTQAAVDHSLRWDVLPIRIRAGKQHAKISLLAWAQHIRLIIASANLTETGYRYNHEVAIPLDSTPANAQVEQVKAASEFLRCLLAFVPGAEPEMPVVKRALAFLHQVEGLVSQWKPAARRKRLRQHLVFTLPGRTNNPATAGPGFDARSTLAEAVDGLRRRGGSPHEAWVASPFFDPHDGGNDAATVELCKAMARRITRRLTVCVPAVGDPEISPLRLAAPRSLLKTPACYSTETDFMVLPQRDADRNERPWHAKMLAFRSPQYSALVVGSSNFTRAGLGISNNRNAEANVLIVAQRESYAREPAELEAVWPEMETIEAPENADWQGPVPDAVEEEAAAQSLLPAGFLVATYRGGEDRQILLRLDPEHLPTNWSISACGQDATSLFDSERWAAEHRSDRLQLPWRPLQPPEKLLVRWTDGEAAWPLNVEDARQLPPPAELTEMSADEMLRILAATDPSAAFRAWAKGKQATDGYDDELDTAVPTDLDPLARYSLQATFLHRIRNRSRVLAALREQLERPAYSEQAVQWRLEGFIGVKPLAHRLADELVGANGRIDEALLTLTDLLIVLRDIRYQATEGAISRQQHDRIYRPFLRCLVEEIEEQVQPQRTRISSQLQDFWDRVVERCRR